LDLLLGELDTLEKCLGEEAAGVRGTLTIAASPAYGALRIAPVIADFMACYPDCRVRLNLADRLAGVVDDGVDIAITAAEIDDPNCVSRRLSAVRMLVCATAEYLVRHGRPEQPEDLISHNCLVHA